MYLWVKGFESGWFNFPPNRLIITGPIFMVQEIDQQQFEAA